MSKKAQFVSIEFILTMIIFIGLLSVLYFFYSYLTSDYILAQDDLELVQVEDFMYTALFLTQGNPHNWDILNLTLDKPDYIGLLDGSGNLALAKIEALATYNDTEYTNFKQILGPFANTTDVSLRIFEFDGTSLTENTTYQFGVVRDDYSKRYVREHFISSPPTPYVVRMEVFYE